MALYKKYREEAAKQFVLFRQEPFFMSGLAMYWGEGDNKLQNGRVRVTNSDPRMIRAFHIFLKKYLPEISHKAKMYLILYPDLDDLRCKSFWAKSVGIPLSRFTASTYIQGRSAKRRLPYGVGTITIASRTHKEIIKTWIALFRREIRTMRV